MLKRVIFKNSALFPNCVSGMNNTEIDDAHTHNIDVAMPRHNLIEYSDNYSKKSGTLWQYYRDESVLTSTDGFNTNNSTNKLFKIKE